MPPLLSPYRSGYRHNSMFDEVVVFTDALKDPAISHDRQFHCVQVTAVEPTGACRGCTLPSSTSGDSCSEPTTECPASTPRVSRRALLLVRVSVLEAAASDPPTPRLHTTCVHLYPLRTRERRIIDDDYHNYTRSSFLVPSLNSSHSTTATPRAAVYRVSRSERLLRKG